MSNSVDQVLEFFEESGEDDVWVHFDIKEGYTASWKHEDIVVISISHDRQRYAIHSTERGELEATEDAVKNLVIHELKRVY
jgi:hypothetical protein